MVLGLTQLLAPLRPANDPAASTEACCSYGAEEAVGDVLKGLQKATAASVVPACLTAELREALEEEAPRGEVHLRKCAAFVTKHLTAVRVSHTATEATPIAMEALRIEGLKAIKKWRAWQAFKSADRIDALAAFMYAKPDTGSVVLELPRLVPDDPVPDGTMRRALVEAVARLTGALEELAPGDAEEKELVAFELVALFETLTAEETEEPLVQLGAALCYSLARVRNAKRPLDWAGWPAEVLGTKEDYAEWRKVRRDRVRAVAARLALEASGRAPVPELNVLRPRDSRCGRCDGQTYLVEEHTRRSDEPSDWFRLCPVCNTVTRPKA